MLLVNTDLAVSILKCLKCGKIQERFSMYPNQGTYPNQQSAKSGSVAAEERPVAVEGRAPVPYPSSKFSSTTDQQIPGEPSSLTVYGCVFSAVAELQRMFPTPPSLEQHAAFSPIMMYRDTPSQEPVGAAVAHDQPSCSQSNSQITDFKMDMEEEITEDVLVRFANPCLKV